MSGSVFVMGTDGELKQLRESGYLTEDELQALLADYPALLAGDDGEKPLRLILVRREAGLTDQEGGSDRWSMDHLFFDQDAVPTIVEVKRSSDTRLRREVVGQMLDYAANAVVYLPPERLRSWYEDMCAAAGQDPALRMAQAFGQDVEPDEFWGRAATNLQAGRLRLLFVADHVPNELRRVVEFLNEQMASTDVLAIEVVQYLGDGVRTLVPKTYGQTQRARTAKSVGGGRPRREWNLETFRATLAARDNPAEIESFDALTTWAAANRLRFWFGKGAFTGSLYFQHERPGSSDYTFSVWTNGGIGLEFGGLKKSPAFQDPDARRELVRRLNEIPGLSVSPDKIDGWPGLRLDAIARAGIDRFLTVYDWVISQLDADAGDDGEDLHPSMQR